MNVVSREIKTSDSNDSSDSNEIYIELCRKVIGIQSNYRCVFFTS
jgi:hypothetical protein